MEQKEDKEITMYQTLFNDTLSRLRLILIATGNQDLIKAAVKIMFDFSDSLKDKGLINDKEYKNGMDKNTY